MGHWVIGRAINVGGAVANRHQIPRHIMLLDYATVASVSHCHHLQERQLTDDLPIITNLVIFV